MVEFEGECKAKIVAAASVDPSELRTLVEKKINKRVEILSPLPKKEDKKDRGQKSENDKPKEKEALTFLSPLFPHLLMFSRFENLINSSHQISFLCSFLRAEQFMLPLIDVLQLYLRDDK